MNIGIDIDDTITQTFEYSYPLSKEYTKKYCNRESKNIEDLASVNHYYLKIINDWNTEEELDFWDKNYKKIIQNVKIKADAKRVIDKLRENGAKIYLITARMKTENFDAYEETRKWLKLNEVEYDELIIDAVNKNQIAKNKNIDIFIDDSFENCISVANEGIKTFIIETEINKGLENENINRVYSWNEIYEKLKV